MAGPSIQSAPYLDGARAASSPLAGRGAPNYLPAVAATFPGTSPARADARFLGPVRLGLSRVARYAGEAASIARTMARYAATRRRYGVDNGLDALGALAREVRSAVRREGGPRACPICGWSGPAFGPAYYVDEYRRGVRCYGCGSTDRCRLVKLYIERHLARFFAQRRRRVLDIGPVRYSRRFFPDDVDYVSFDLRPGVALVQGDLCAAPFPDASFDLWLCFHVLDLIPDDGAAMRELYRVLRPGGVGLLDNVMNWSGLTEEYGRPRPEESFHLRRYGTDLPDRLRALGLAVEKVDTNDALDAETRERFGIQHRIFLLCRRPP